MSIKLRKTIIAAVAVVSSVAMIAPSFAGAVTIDELLAQIAQLQMQLQTMQGGAGAGACAGVTFSRTLTVGSTGSDVKCLQVILNMSASTKVASSGAGSPGMETMYFGPLTLAAVKMYQTQHGWTPANQVGPMTRAALNAQVSAMGSGSGTGTGVGTSVGLTGTASIKTITDLSQYSVEDVGEGTSDVVVLGREIEMDNTGNARLQQVRVKFTHASGTETSGSSTTLSKYANAVSIWLDGKKIASAMASDFSRDSSGVYSKTFITDSSAILNSGAKNNLTIAITAVSNLDSGDAAEQWGLNIENIRYVDGTGAVITDTSTGDLETEELAKFVTLATATDIELKLTPNNNPVAKTTKVSTTTNTMNIDLLSFNVKAQGEKIWVDEIPVVITTVGGDSPSALVAKLTLTLGSATFTETLPTTGTGTDCDLSATLGCRVTFDDINTWIEANQTVSAKVSMEAEDIEAGTFDEGDSITAAISAFERSNIVAEDKNGDNIADGDKTGVVSGEAQAFRSTGIALSNFTSTVTTAVTGANVDGKESTYVVNFKITAFGDTAYVPRVISRATSTTAGLIYLIENSGGSSIAPPVVAIADGDLSSSDATLNTNSLFEIPDGSSRSFSATINLSTTLIGSNDLYRIQLDKVQFDTDSTDTTPDATAESFAPASQYETNLAEVKDAT